MRGGIARTPNQKSSAKKSKRRTGDEMAPVMPVMHIVVTLSAGAIFLPVPTFWFGAKRTKVALAPYSHGTFKFTGPNVEVGPQAINILALVFHELATNAVKYGALSSIAGAVDVAWEQRNKRIVINWVESNGPPVAPPTSAGFGTALATKSIRALRGSIVPTWLPEGLSVQIELPSGVLAQ
jgi:hypothetical protein